MPIAPIPRKPRSFDAEDGAYVAGTDFSHQALESRTFDQPGSGTTQIIIDNDDLSKTEVASSISEAILT
jgi:hypothetical protein